MSLTHFVPEKNRLYRRLFDHEEALRRYKAGERVADLAAEYGVSMAAVYRVITPGAKRRDVERNKAWRTVTCESCGGPAMKIMGGKKAHNPDGRILCVRCRGDVKRERLRFDELGQLAAVRCTSHNCANGERWQQPENFTRGVRHRHVREGGIHSLCRACQTRARRLWRREHAERQRQYDRTYKARKRSAAA